MYCLVDLDHKGMKVDPAFSADFGGKCVVKEIHKHGLAGAYIAVEVKALWRCRGCGRGSGGAKEARELIGVSIIRKAEYTTDQRLGTARVGFKMVWGAK